MAGNDVEVDAQITAIASHPLRPPDLPVVARSTVRASGAPGSPVI